MRQLLINIEKRVDRDRAFVFNGINADPIYAFSSATVNYSISSSNVTSMLFLTVVGGMPETQDAIRSGQYVTIEDNGDIIFQGNVLSAVFKQSIIPASGISQLMLNITLAPSIFQLALAPLIFDNAQATNIGKLLGIDIAASLVGKTQQSKISDFFNGIIQNTDYSNYFKKTIQYSDLDNSVYTITGTGATIDSVVRSTLSYFNAVFYQQEDGTIIVRQLDPSIESPFDIDLNNQNLSTTSVTSSPDIIPVAPLLEWEYVDNACSTPSIVSGYNIISANIASLINNNTKTDSFPLIVSYKPNSVYYPRMGELISTGWFVGAINNTQINDNIVTDPALSTIVEKYFQFNEQYLTASTASGAPNSVSFNNQNIITAYQKLMATKEMASLLARYSSVSGYISLDDPNLQNVNLNKVVGTCLQIGNCDMKSGIIASCSRMYSIGTPLLAITVLPLGSITGYWKNSTFNPTFTGG